MDEITLKLTKEEILIIQDGLLELPAKKSLRVINKITSQVQEQINNKEQQ